MTSETIFNPSPSVSFIIKNNSTIRRSIKIFGQSIYYNSSFDLMKIPGITEEDIRTEVLKGTLRRLLEQGTFQVVSSSVNFKTTDSAHGAFLQRIGIKTNNSSNGALTQANWYIDSINGNDQNDGSTNSKALKTHAEFARRLGNNNILAPDYQLFLGSIPFRLVSVNILNDLPFSDPIMVNCILGQDTILSYSATPKTPIATGTINGLITKNRSSNQPYTIINNTIDWTANLYKRLRISSGPRAGAMAYALEHVDGYDGYCITSDWSIPNPAPLPGLTPIVPQIGDTFVIEDLVKCNMGAFNVSITGNNSSIFQFNCIAFSNLEFQQPDNGALDLVLPDLSVAVMLNGCRFACFPGFHGGALFVDNTCFLAAGFFWDTLLIQNGGCAVVANAATPSFGLAKNYVFYGNSFVLLDADFMTYNSPMIHVGPGGARALLGYVGCFKAQFSVEVGGLDHPGNGVMIFSSADVINKTLSSGGNAIWGSGNTSHGIFVEANSFFGYTTTVPTVTGTAGDFALGKETQTQSYAFNPATQAYTTARNNTWTNISTSIDSGGFGGSAVDPRTGARLIDFTDGV